MKFNRVQILMILVTTFMGVLLPSIMVLLDMHELGMLTDQASLKEFFATFIDTAKSQNIYFFVYIVLPVLFFTISYLACLIFNKNDMVERNLRLADLGKTAASIAHEINNPLAIINFKTEQLQIILKQFGLEEGQEKMVTDVTKSMQDTVQRISKIIAGLKNMVRDGTSDELAPFNLKESCERTRLLVENNYRGKSTRLDFNIPKQEVVAQVVQFEQCLTNLLNNALDAVQELDEKWVRVDYFNQGEYHVIRITDSGRGIPKDIAKKIMQPMYTTKKVGEGTGLGLSFVKGVLNSYGGDLQYKDEFSNTTFDMTIPVNPKM